MLREFGVQYIKTYRKQVSSIVVTPAVAMATVLPPIHVEEILLRLFN